MSVPLSWNLMWGWNMGTNICCRHHLALALFRPGINVYPKLSSPRGTDWGCIWDLTVRPHLDMFTCSCTCPVSSPWFISRMPAVCTHTPMTHTGECTDAHTATHIPVAGEHTRPTAMATVKLTQFPWWWRQGRWLAADPDTPTFHHNTGRGMESRVWAEIEMQHLRSYNINFGSGR